MEIERPALSASDIERAATAANSLILSSIEKLGSEVQAGGTGAPRLFFPNGIELINVEVSLGGTSGLKLVVKIAGATGIKATAVEAESADSVIELQPLDSEK